MGKKSNAEKVFNELLLIVHPGWLKKLLEYNRTYLEELFLPPRENPYASNKPVLVERGTKKLISDVMDWKRYRKAMFDRYGKAIIDASKRDDVVVAFLLTPKDYKEYKEAVENRAERKKLSDAARLALFAKKHLKKRIFVVQTPELLPFREAMNNLRMMLSDKGIKFSEFLVVRGIGEISNRCVAQALREAKILFNPQKTYVDKKYCGDVLKGIHPRRIRKHTMRKPKINKRRLKR